MCVCVSLHRLTLIHNRNILEAKKMTRPAKAPSVDELKESLRQVEQKKAAKQEGKGSITTLSVLPGVQDELQENLLPQEPLEARPVKAAKQELDELDELLQQAELLQQVPPLLPENAVVSNLPVVGFEESWLPPNALYGCVERRGDCFFESIGQQLTALKIAHPAGLPLGQYIRSVVAEFWLQKTSDDRESDFGAIKCDATLMLDTSVVSVEEFIRWIRLTSDFVRQTLDSHSQNPAGHQQPAKNPYWGGVMDLEVRLYLIRSTNFRNFLIISRNRESSGSTRPSQFMWFKKVESPCLARAFCTCG